LRRLEAEAAALSLRTLQAGADGTGALTSRIDNSDFLRIIRDLRRVHSHIAALSYPVLERAGESGDRDTEEAPATAAINHAAPPDRSGGPIVNEVEQDGLQSL
jgi:phosphate:Na+ symporter